jgi:two-component system, chemotaxis family, chemotaxis protein CheY
MNARILVVDDSGFARRSLKQLLEGAGHTVEEAKDGHDALERYFLNKPDLVMLDLVMEGMNGMEVLAKLRELDREARVVVATADVQTSTRAEAQATGASGFITKPFDRDEVLKTVSTVLTGGLSWN